MLCNLSALERQREKEQKLREHMLLTLNANDAEGMTFEHLKAVLYMLSHALPELAEVMPNEIELFGKTFLVVSKVRSDDNEV